MRRVAAMLIFGLLGTTAILAVTAASQTDTEPAWFMAGLAIGGFVLLFVIQILLAVASIKE